MAHFGVGSPGADTRPVQACSADAGPFGERGRSSAIRSRVLGSTRHVRPAKKENRTRWVPDDAALNSWSPGHIGRDHRRVRIDRQERAATAGSGPQPTHHYGDETIYASMACSRLEGQMHNPSRSVRDRRCASPVARSTGNIFKASRTRTRCGVITPAGLARQQLPRSLRGVEGRSGRPQSREKLAEIMRSARSHSLGPVTRGSPAADLAWRAAFLRSRIESQLRAAALHGPRLSPRRGLGIVAGCPGRDTGQHHIQGGGDSSSRPFTTTARWPASR